MYCKKCYYDLSHCESHACPECGRAFDPNRAKSYRKKPPADMHPIWSPLRIIVLVMALSGAWYFNVPGRVLAMFEEPRNCCGSSALSQLKSLRSQLELYANQHGDSYPTLNQLQHDWAVLTMETHGADGQITGPYLSEPYINPFTQGTTVAAQGKATPQDAWEYDEATHTLRFVVPDQDTFNQWKCDPKNAVVAQPQSK